jgi:PRA1 family protein
MSSTIKSGSDNNSHEYGSKHQPPISINIETMRLQLSSLAARIQSRVSVDTIRSLPVFLGLSATGCLSPVAFTPPVRKMDKSSFEKVKSRVKLNFAYFLSNYVLLAAITAIVVALMHPGMVFFLGLVYALWTIHGFLIRKELVLFGMQVHAILTVQQRFYALFVITTLVVVMKCLKPTIIFLSISGLMIVSHALLRDPKDVEAFGSDGGESDDEDLEGGGDNSSGSEVLVERPKSKRTSVGNSVK